MKIYGDYHTHTVYSDGLGTVRQNVLAARAAGLKDIGISDHGFNNYSFSLTRKKVARQKAEIDKLRQEFEDINIFYSIEADIISLDGTVDMTLEEMEGFDYIIAGFHRWTRPKSAKDYFRLYIPIYKTFMRAAKPKEIVRHTDAVIKMLTKYPIAIYPHMNSGMYVDPVAVAEACADLEVLVELNVKHLVRNLGKENFEKLLTTRAKFIISSDAHRPERIGRTDRVLEFIKPYNLDGQRVVNLGDKTPDFRTYKNWRK